MARRRRRRRRGEERRREMEIEGQEVFGKESKRETERKERM